MQVTLLNPPARQSVTFQQQPTLTLNPGKDDGTVGPGLPRPIAAGDLQLCGYGAARMPSARDSGESRKASAL